MSLLLPSLAFANAKVLTFVCVHGGLGLPRVQFSTLLFRRNSHPLTRGRIRAFFTCWYLGSTTLSSLLHGLLVPHALLVRISPALGLAYGYSALLPGFLLAVVTQTYRLRSSGTLLFITPWGLRAVSSGDDIPCGTVGTRTRAHVDSKVSPLRVGFRSCWVRHLPAFSAFCGVVRTRTSAHLSISENHCHCGGSNILLFRYRSHHLPVFHAYGLSRRHRFILHSLAGMLRDCFLFGCLFRWCSVIPSPNPLRMANHPLLPTPAFLPAPQSPVAQLARSARPVEPPLPARQLRRCLPP